MWTLTVVNATPSPARADIDPPVLLTLTDIDALLVTSKAFGAAHLMHPRFIYQIRQELAKPDRKLFYLDQYDPFLLNGEAIPDAAMIRSPEVSWPHIMLVASTVTPEDFTLVVE